MVSMPEIIKPDFTQAPLTTFNFSGNQLLFPLPEDVTIRGGGEVAPSEINLQDDSQNYVGNPAEGRYIPLFTVSWNYIAKSSLLVAGHCFANAFLYAVHPRSGLSDESMFNNEAFKKWVLFREADEFEEYQKSRAEGLRFSGREIREDEHFIYPTSDADLKAYTEHDTPKCCIKSGDPLMPWLNNAIYIPVSDHHVLLIRLDFDGFPTGLMGPLEEIDKLLDGYAREFFSHIRVDYTEVFKQKIQLNHG